MNSIAVRIAKEKAALSAQYPNKIGKYRGEVRAMKAHDGFKGLSLITELKIVKADKTDPNVEPHKIGDVVSYVEKLESNPQKSGGGRYKSHLMCVTGATEDQMNDQQIGACLNEAPKSGVVQPCFGLFVDFEVFPKTLAAKDGKPERKIEALRWSNVPEAEQPLAEVPAKRQAAGLPPLK